MDYISSAVKNLFRKKFRCILTLIGISIGVISVIIIGNISNCGSTMINNELENLGMDGIIISTSSNIYTSDENVPLGEKELEAIKSLSSVENAVPLTVESAVVTVHNNEYQSMLWGITADTNQVISMSLLYGRYISMYDINSANNVCLVDQAFAQSIYNRDNIVGKSIYIDFGGVRDKYEVVGIVKTGGDIMGSIVGNIVPEFVYIPYTTMQKYRYSTDFQKIAIQVNNGYNIDSVCNIIENKLNKINNLSSSYSTMNMLQQKDGLNSILNIVTMILSCVGAISLLVASLSIMTIMTVAVSERKREIGIKKALGAKKSDIITEFLIEAVLISLIGCTIGVIISMSVSYIVILILGINIKLKWDIVIYTSIFSVICGIIFGVYPAIKASKLSPIDALRME